MTRQHRLIRRSVHVMDLHGIERDAFDPTGDHNRRSRKPRARIPIALLVRWQQRLCKELGLDVFPAPLYRISIELDLLFCPAWRIVLPNATVDATSPFGFIGVAGLVGCFQTGLHLNYRKLPKVFFPQKNQPKAKTT